MLRLNRIGVTGGVASGKTTVCRCLEELGAYVVSADQIVHHLLIPTTDLGKEVEELLGSDCVINGKFDRQLMSRKVFNDLELLFRLEQVIHPKVRIKIKEEFNKALNQSPMPTLFVAEVPLLYEAHFEDLFDKVIAVISEKEESEKRHQARGGNHFALRRQRLLSHQELQKQADYFIYNNGDIDQLRSQVINLYKFNLFRS